MLQKWSMDSKKMYQENYSLWNEVHMKNSGLYQIGPKINEDICDKIKIKPVIDCFKSYQKKWKNMWKEQV
jgi:hypothetical protein